MIFGSQVGRRVWVHYRKGVREHMPLQGKVGVVRIAPKGRPRNYGVEIDGKMCVVPGGNLNKATTGEGTTASAAVAHSGERSE